MKISAKVPAEIIPVVFDFASLSLTSVDSVIQTGVEVTKGTDAAASSMLLGSPTLTGTTAVQLVRNGVAGCTYNLSCLVAVGNERYQLDANMDCKARHS
jgi:hypothetical protein